jgi:hypothetical protein
MREFAIIAGYWIITGVVTTGLIFRNVCLSRRLSSWKPPSTVTSHSGERFPDEFRFFADPGVIGTRILTAEATAEPDGYRIAMIRLLVGAAYGAAWGVFGVWLSEIPAGMMQWVLVSATAAIMARENLRDFHNAYITFVSEEGCGMVTFRCDAGAKHFLPHMTEMKCYSFSDIDAGSLRGNEIKLSTHEGTFSRIVVLRRPPRLPADHWKRWFNSCVTEFEDIRYCKSLRELANIGRLTYGLPDTVNRTCAVNFLVTSVLGERAYSGPEFIVSPNGGITRLPLGRIGYCEQGLVIENWLPLYDSVSKSDLGTAPFELLLWGIAPLSNPVHVRETISRWEVEHVIALPLDAIDSIREEVDSFSINAKDGRVFAFLKDQVIGCSTLLRLIQGSIWSHGIIGELQREILEDVKQLCDSGEFDDSCSQIFGSRLPNHRAMIWYTAYRLGMRINVGNDMELQLKERAFVDCLRVLPGCAGMEGYLMRGYLDSGRSFDDSKTCAA